MKSCWMMLARAATLLASDDAVSRLLDSRLTAAQRSDACFALRGHSKPEVLAALSRMLADPAVRACAARDLREAGAVDELKSALASGDADTRALAAGELGALERPELLPLLAAAAADANVLVAAGAVRGLAQYRDPAAVPYLLEVARKGGIPGIAALERAAEFRSPAALQIARAWLAGADVASKVVALQVIGDLGDTSDLPRLREIAARREKLSARGRGFGLLPVIDLGRAAENAVARIQSRGLNPTSARPQPGAPSPRPGSDPPLAPASPSRA